MTYRFQAGVGVVLLAAALFALTQLVGRADDAAVKLVVSPAIATDLIKDDIKVATDALNLPKPLPKDVKRAKVATMIVALHAKASAAAGKDADKNNALYAQAIKVLTALAKEDGLPDAKKEAALLSNPPVGGTAEGDAIKLALWDPENKDYDQDMAMQLFKLPRAGGLGYEKMIKDLSEKNPTAKDMPAVAILANKTAMIAQAIEQIAKAKAAGPGKGPAEWKKYAQDLQKSAAEAGAAAGKKDAAAVKAALGKMDTSCVNCHEKFKQS